MDLKKPFAGMLLATIILNAQAQSTNLGSSETSAIFSKMKPEVAAQLAIQNQVGTCRALKVGNAGARYLYSLTYFISGKKRTERFGHQFQIQSVPLLQVIKSTTHYVPESKLKQVISQIKNNLIIPSAYAYTSISGDVQTLPPTPVSDPVGPGGGGGVGTVNWGSLALIEKIDVKLVPEYKIPEFSQVTDADAKLSLGNRVKTLVQQGRCGNIVFETFKQKLTDMKGKVDFYMRNGKLTCLAGDFVARIRNPQDCQMKVVKSVLPDSVCNLLYQIEANHSGRNAQQGDPSNGSGGSGTSVSAGTGVVANIALPALKPLTLEIEEEIAISEVLQQNPELAALTESAEEIKAEHMLPVSTLDLLESQTITSTTFDSLSSNQKVDLVNLVRTYDSIKDSSEHVQFSPEIISTINSIKIKANSYATANSVGAIYSMPLKEDLKLHFDAKLDVLVKVTKKPFLYNLGCAHQAIKVEPRSFAQAL
jgi:hypothetical protein